MIAILFSRPGGPPRPRGGGQKVIKPVKPPPPSSGGKKRWLPGCPLSVAVIAVPALLAACSLVQHGP